MFDGLFDVLLSWPAMIAAAAAALVLAWYLPPLRPVIAAAFGALAIAFTIRKSGERAGQAEKQKEWNDAEDAMRDRARDLNERARDAVDAAPGGVRGSPYDRDNR